MVLFMKLSVAFSVTKFHYLTAAAQNKVTVIEKPLTIAVFKHCVQRQ